MKNVYYTQMIIVGYVMFVSHFSAHVKKNEKGESTLFLYRKNTNTLRMSAMFGTLLKKKKKWWQVDNEDEII